MSKSRAITTRRRRSPIASASLSTSAPTPPPHADPEAERMARRLGEMVAGLTECDPDAAISAVRAVLAVDAGLDALDVVARATLAVETQTAGDRGESRPEPAPAPAAHPSRRLSAIRARRPRSRTRRPATAPPPARSAHHDVGAVIIDLRDERAGARLDLTHIEPWR